MLILSRQYFLSICGLLICISFALSQDRALVLSQDKISPAAKEFYGLLLSPVCGYSKEATGLTSYQSQHSFFTTCNNWLAQQPKNIRLILYLSGESNWQEEVPLPSLGGVSLSSLGEYLHTLPYSHVVVILKPEGKSAPLGKKAWQELAQMASSNRNTLVLSGEGKSLDVPLVMGMGSKKILSWNQVAQNLENQGGIAFGQVKKWNIVNLNKRPELSQMWIHNYDGSLRFWWEGLRFYTSFFLPEQNMLLSGTLSQDRLSYAWQIDEGVNSGQGKFSWEDGYLVGSWQLPGEKMQKLELLKLERPLPSSVVSIFPSPNSLLKEDRIQLKGQIRTPNLQSVIINKIPARITRKKSLVKDIWLFQSPIFLVPGLNKIKVETYEEETKNEWEIHLFRSFAASQIEVTQPSSETILHSPEVLVEGIVSGEAEIFSILVGGQRAKFEKIARDGITHLWKFERTLKLKSRLTHVPIRVEWVGGQAEEKTHTLKYLPIDTEAPKIYVQKPNLKKVDKERLVYQKQVQVEGRVTDNQGLVELRVEDQVYPGESFPKEMKFSYSLSMEEGEKKTLFLSALDKMGNLEVEKISIRYPPIPSKFRILEIRFVDAKGKSKENFHNDEEIYLQVRWNVAQAGSNDYENIQISGEGVIPSFFRRVEKAEKGHQEERISLRLASEKAGRYKVRVNLGIGSLNRRKNASLEIIRRENLGWFGEKIPRGLVVGETKGEYVWKKDGAVMVYVPAGFFWRGSSRAQDEEPIKKIFVSGFYIDKNEATNQRYQKFLRETAYPQPAFYHDTNFNQPRQPVIGINWEDAQEYCKWSEKRLPSEAQWEKAARGGVMIPNWESSQLPVPLINNPIPQRVYPWGDEKPGQGTTYYCNYFTDGADGYRYTSPVEIFSYWVSPYRNEDMAGNAWEWCLDSYDSRYYSTGPEKDPLNSKSGIYKVLRGGSWFASPKDLRVSFRYGETLTARRNLFGFRTVLLGEE